MADAANPVLEADLTVDTRTYNADSAYDSELASFTTSLASSVVDYKTENGRRYHAYKEGNYIYPNDEAECDRLDIMHQLMQVSLGGKLHLAPFKETARILDIGTGTGIWAMDIGDEHPQAEVLGNDLSPIQPRWVPPNVRFEVDDVESEWTYSRKFDFIHCRCMYAAIQNWPRLVGQVYDNLQPGAYAEFTDMDLEWRSPDDSLKGTVSDKVMQTFLGACRQGGRDPCPGPSLEGWVTSAGFEDVHVRKMIAPMGTWTSDKNLKEVGAWNYLQTMEGLESFLLAIFTRMLGYQKAEVDVMCAEVRKNLKDPKFHTYYLIYSVYGRKPEGNAKKEEEE